MIYDAATLSMPLTLQADLCVVGSGAGGSMVAMVAAEAGLKVVLLEAGAYLTPGDMSQREEEMFPQLFWDAGNRTTADRAVRIHQGRGVGGSTLHNINLCKRIPDALLAEWRLESLPKERWHALYDEVEGLLEVSDIPRERWNRHNRLLEDGCAALGWEGGPLRHNRTGCVGSGFCEIGCAYDAKNNALKVLVPRAVRAGCEILAHCQAIRVTHGKGGVTGVDAVALDPEWRRSMGAIRIDARQVCVAASATATAALLLRSDVPAPDGSVGDTLHLHPGVVVAGEFADPVRAWEGVPQTYECTEYLRFHGDDRRLWILPAFAHPVATATLLPGMGEGHRALMERYAHFGVLTAMLHDRTAGRVRPRGDLGLRIDYWPDAADAEQLVMGLQACARLLFAAGAVRVVVPMRTPLVLQSVADIAQLAQVRLERGLLDITAVHPMSSVPMGDDPRRTAVATDGRFRGIQGLWIADGSLFPSSIGVPPQLSIYALGLHVGRHIAATPI